MNGQGPNKMPRPRRTALRIAMAALGWAALAAACPAAAQEKTFDIPAEDAVAALPAFVQQSGRQVLADARELGGIRTNAVRGRMDADTALARLLAGTGLIVKARGFSPGDRSIAVGRAPAPAQRSVVLTAVAPPPADPTLVVVTSYRQSLQSAAEAQRRAVNFTDAVYAQD